MNVEYTFSTKVSPQKRRTQIVLSFIDHVVSFTNHVIVFTY